MILPFCEVDVTVVCYIFYVMLCYVKLCYVMLFIVRVYNKFTYLTDKFKIINQHIYNN